jgi:hypothetical protein
MRLHQIDTQWEKNVWKTLLSGFCLEYGWLQIFRRDDMYHDLGIL